jgi:uncharacterized protein
MNNVHNQNVSNPTTVKLVVDGSSGCGKTTFVNALSDIQSDMQAASSSQSVAMDFGRIQIDDDSVLYLFGMPGGRRYDFMWDVLKDGLLGFIVILDSRYPSKFRESRRILETFRAYIPTPYVIAANFQDYPEAWGISDLRIALRIPAEIAVIPCVATEKESVKAVLIALLEKVIEDLDVPDESRL